MGYRNHQKRSSARRFVQQKNRSLVMMALLGVGLLLIGISAISMLPNNSSVLAGGYPSVIPVEVSFPAPELAIVDLQGNPVSLQEYRGQVVLVNNWATWCPPCKAEMPIFQEYYEAHKDQGFVLVAIDIEEKPDVVRKFVEEYQLTFPIWLDEKGESLVAFSSFSLPNSHVIDRNGIVRLSWVGAIDRATLEAYVTPLFSE